MLNRYIRLTMRMTPSTQEKLQAVLKAQDYLIRYERGNFKGGYCIVQDQRVILVNKFYPLESKINTLVDIIREIEIDEAGLSSDLKHLVHQIKNTPKE